MILIGDCRERLADLPAGSVHTVITSPPYFGLRDYGTGEWMGGDEACDHVKSELRTGKGLAEWSAANARGGGHKAATVESVQFSGVCGKCGAERVDRQIGLEPTPDEFVEAVVSVFREVRRVLRDDGTVWLNLGDSYCAAASGPTVPDRPTWEGGFKVPSEWRRKESRVANNRVIPGVKQKDLLMVPAQVALALRADGWYLRSEIVWAKPNPMPESVSDRPTSAHEKVFLLSKSSRYFYDADAIREAASYGNHERTVTTNGRGHHGGDIPPGARPHMGLRQVAGVEAGRNKRNVWEIATAPFAEAHFATFPPALVEPCLLAGSSPQACGQCGASWERVTERTYENPGNRRSNGPRALERAEFALGANGAPGFAQRLEARVRTLGWRSTCEHDDGSGRCVVLDPFAGSGTVGVVCEWYGREFLGVELKAEYAEMAERRIAVEGRLGRRAYRPQKQPDEQTAFDV